MTSGLPTFATSHGGPREIIEDGLSGFHVDPYHPDNMSAKMLDFFERSKEDPSYWNKISEGGLRRIYERSLIFIYFLIFGRFSFLVLKAVVKIAYNIVPGTHGKSILRD